MATTNIYSKTQCNAIIPLGEDHVAQLNDCFQEVQLNGYYVYDAGWQWPSPSTVAFYSASVSLVVIAAVMVLKYRHRQDD